MRQALNPTSSVLPACATAPAAGASVLAAVSSLLAACTTLLAAVSTLLAAVSSVLAAALLVGCGASSTSSSSSPTPPPYTPPVGNYAGAAFGGKVMAGALPVIGASVQIYAAGTAGNGSAPTQLLSSAVTTDSNGAFSIAAGYTCPYNTSILYVVASGGRAGAAGAVNGGTELMSSPGACSAVTTGAGYVLNEATTVAAAYAFSPFLAAGAKLGASSTNSSGMTLAAATLANLVNLTTGAMPGPGFPATGTAPVAKLSTLADALNACIVSSGAGSAACSGLYSDSVLSGTPPGDTLDAAVSIAQHPGVSGTALYALSLASNAYAGLAAAPPDWTLFATYKGGGMNDPSAVSIDSAGRVWVANYYSTASLFTNTGTPVFATGLTGNGLYESYGGAVDANDVMWVTNEQGGSTGLGSLTLLSSAGAAPAGTPYSSGGIDFPYAVAVDATNVSWIADFGDSHVTLLSNAGVPLSGASGYDGVQNGVGTFAFPVAVAVDGNRNGWVANQSSNTIVKVAPDGSSFVSYAPCPVASGVAIDQGNNVWATCYLSSTVMRVSAAGAVTSGSGFTGGGLDQPQGIAVDGAGTVWVANYRGPSLTELAGGSGSVAAGTALSPAAGWGPDAGLLEAYALAIDAGGNVWVTNFGSNTLTEFIGLAIPVKTPLLGPVRVP